MKKLYHSCIKCSNWALAGMLTLMGFNVSCDDENGGDGGGMVEYGTPHASYVIKGKVVDPANNPIPNIQIKCAAEHSYSEGQKFVVADSTNTDDSGAFHATFGVFPTEKIKVIATDIDGKLNGSFEKDSVEVTIHKEDYKNGSHWNKGEATKEVTLTLKASKDE